MPKMTVGRVAQLTTTSIDAIHFYEKRGLLGAVSRSDNGYRVYDDHAIKKLLFIKSAKVLGFTLPEIGELLELRDNPYSTSVNARERAMVKAQDIRLGAEGLQKMEQMLTGLAKQCLGKGPLSERRILSALDEQHE